SSIISAAAIAPGSSKRDCRDKQRELAARIRVIGKFFVLPELQRNLTLRRCGAEAERAGGGARDAEVGPCLAAEEPGSLATRRPPIFLEPGLVLPFQLRRVQRRVEIGIAAAAGDPYQREADGACSQGAHSAADCSRGPIECQRAFVAFSYSCS